MNLLVDIGNTRVKWCFSEGDVCYGFGVLENAVLSEKRIDEVIAGKDIEKILLSNVGKSEVSRMFGQVAEKRGLQFFAIESRREIAGVKFSYPDIARLGVDRCLAMVAAYKNKGVLVIDAGSAITADYLDDDGYHLGGYILPGCQMLLGSLNSGTSRIEVDVLAGISTPGKSTEECVGNGLALMLHSIMKSFVDMAASYGIEEFVVTGGDAEVLVEACPAVTFIRRANLVLDGLLKIQAEIEGGKGVGAL